MILKSGGFLPIYTVNGLLIDILYNQSPDITADFFSVGIQVFIPFLFHFR